MSSHLVRLRERNQLTLPPEIADKLKVKPGSLLELILEADDEGPHVELRHAEVVRAGTRAAQRSEERAKEDIREGRFTTYANTSELAGHMKQTRENEAKELRAQIEEMQQQMLGLVCNMRRVGAAAGVTLIEQAFVDNL
ncbi:MAG: AbrB/MazE/SpoVT family DNA-binding domain-containing protein [Terriglobales bacterium]|jgi:bifunctional DNA-binding transcriptional regulator/antitoxin component of YhaV-PrlF toxin-antitoxin module